MDALDILCAQLTRNLFAIAKFLFLVLFMSHFASLILICLLLIHPYLVSTCQFVVFILMLLSCIF